jgi:hypothetical protein
MPFEISPLHRVLQALGAQYDVMHPSLRPRKLRSHTAASSATSTLISPPRECTLPDALLALLTHSQRFLTPSGYPLIYLG